MLIMSVLSRTKLSTHLWILIWKKIMEQELTKWNRAVSQRYDTELKLHLALYLLQIWWHQSVPCLTFKGHCTYLHIWPLKGNAFTCKHKLLRRMVKLGLQHKGLKIIWLYSKNLSSWYFFIDWAEPNNISPIWNSYLVLATQISLELNWGGNSSMCEYHHITWSSRTQIYMHTMPNAALKP